MFIVVFSCFHNSALLCAMWQAVSLHNIMTKKKKKRGDEKEKMLCRRKAPRNHVLNTTTHLHTHLPIPIVSSLLSPSCVFGLLFCLISEWYQWTTASASIASGGCDFYEEQIYVTNAANQQQHLVWYKHPQLREKAHGNTHVECFPNQGHPGPIEGSL